MIISNDKIKKIEEIIFKNEKTYGKGIIQFGEEKIEPCPIICSTGSISLDSALGIGGFPKGKHIEVVGFESSSKTSLALLSIAEIQKNGGICFFCDAEQSFSNLYASQLGVDVKNLIKFQPDNAEMAYEIIEDLVSSGLVNFGVVDSTSALVPKSEVNGSYGDATMASQARLLSQALRKLTPILAKSDCSIYWISQIRKKIGLVFGSNDVYGVGEAMRFYASIRIRTTKAETEKTDEEGQSSIKVKCNVFKNKVAPPFKQAEFTLLTGVNGEYGLDVHQEILDFGVKYEFIQKSGTWYSLGEDRIGQGKENAKKYFKENPEKFEEVKNKIKDKLFEENFKNVNPNSFSAKAQEIQEKVENKRKPRSKTVDNNDVPENVDQETGEIITDIE